MTNLYFEELEIGTRSAAGPYPVSRDEIIQFAKQYDPVPRHVDEEAAARSVFGGLTATSAHTFAIFILLTTRLQPRLHVLAGLGWDELRLPNAASAILMLARLNIAAPSLRLTQRNGSPAISKEKACYNL